MDLFKKHSRIGMVWKDIWDQSSLSTLEDPISRESKPEVTQLVDGRDEIKTKNSSLLGHVWR